ncbi:MAG: A/G-specific adenine glycosylase [Ferruginibacter sp.]
MSNTEQQDYFVKSLLKWNRNDNDRQMPWKGEKDPYKIWLSEIILQQTRVAQGLNYYHQFVNTFPTIQELAAAPETKVFKLWEGLGYYTRCKNLLATAKYISNELNGNFPAEYEDVLALKGIGPYTAAAISSFAFNLPHAVVDGNVFRVLSRFFGIGIPTDSKEGIQLFNRLAKDLLDKKSPGIYNQALMDFGAIVCKPALPLCGDCPLQQECVAFKEGTVNLLPVKEKVILKRKRWFYYFVIEQRGKVFVRKRPPGDIWENLYEFLLIETANTIAVDHLPELVKTRIGETDFEVESISPVYKQLLTHQTITGQFIYVKTGAAVVLNGYKAVSKKALLKLPFAKFTSNYLKDKNVSLNWY